MTKREDSLADYYEDLQISRNADQETIERVFRLLAKRYHPDNRVTGNVEKFEVLTNAFRTLSDPVKRAAYDAGYEQVAARRWALPPPPPGAPGYSEDREIRNAILSILYIERRNSPVNGSVGLWRMEQLLGRPEAVLEFHVWYLKEKDLVQRTDSGGYAITVGGVDVIEANGILSSQDFLLPEKSSVPDRARSDVEASRAEEPSPRLVEGHRGETAI